MTKQGSFVPSQVIALDIATGNIEIPYPSHKPLATYNRVRALARLGGIPIGFVELLEVESIDEAALTSKVRADAWMQYRTEINGHFAAAGLAAPTSPADLEKFQPASARDIDASILPLVTVSVSTLHNDEAALETVARILQNDYPNFEVLIVDNSSDLEPLDTKVAGRFGDDDRVRHVLEPRRGLSRARNKGWKEAKGEIVVFTDDDVIVDPRWIGEIVAGFRAAPNVGVVTGSIIPAELETPAQDWLEQFGGFNKGFERQLFDLEANSRPEPLYPFDAGRFGSGANVALTKEALDELNGFANDLGAGTPAWGGEDIDILRRAVSAGFTIAYEPGALMWHRHRRSYAALRKQMYRYGVGLSATVTKWFMEGPTTGWQILKRLPVGAVHVLGPKSKKNRAKATDYPKILSFLELAGLLVGPFAYIRSRRHVRSVDTGNSN